jgi:hypothetical protein
MCNVCNTSSIFNLFIYAYCNLLIYCKIQNLRHFSERLCSLDGAVRVSCCGVRKVQPFFLQEML